MPAPDTRPSSFRAAGRRGRRLFSRCCCRMVAEKSRPFDWQSAASHSSKPQEGGRRRPRQPAASPVPLGGKASCWAVCLATASCSNNNREQARKGPVFVTDVCATPAACFQPPMSKGMFVGRARGEGLGGVGMPVSAARWGRRGRGAACVEGDSALAWSSFRATRERGEGLQKRWGGGAGGTAKQRTEAVRGVGGHVPHGGLGGLGRRGGRRTLPCAGCLGVRGADTRQRLRPATVKRVKAVSRRGAP